MGGTLTGEPKTADSLSAGHANPTGGDADVTIASTEAYILCTGTAVPFAAYCPTVDVASHAVL
jgi:hypothetical protein